MIYQYVRCAEGSAALGLFALPGVARYVTLTLRDGTLSILGVFQCHDGELFRVMTQYGPLTVDGEGVVCEGPACPDLTSPVAGVRVVGEADAGRLIGRQLNRRVEIWLRPSKGSAAP